MSPRIERAQTRPSRYDSSFSASLSLSPLSLSLSPSPSSFLPQPCWPASLLFFFFPGFVDLSFHGSTFANLARLFVLPLLLPPTIFLAASFVSWTGPMGNANTHTRIARILQIARSRTAKTIAVQHERERESSREIVISQLSTGQETVPICDWERQNGSRKDLVALWLGSFSNRSNTILFGLNWLLTEFVETLSGIGHV